MNSYLSNIRSYLIERYQQILNFCAFLVFAALLTLTVASVMEYQIEKKTIEVERLHLKELNILKWVTSLGSERNLRTNKLILGEFLLNTLPIDGMENPLKEKQIFLANVIQTGSYTHELLINDLKKNFIENSSEE